MSVELFTELNPIDTSYQLIFAKDFHFLSGQKLISTHCFCQLPSLNAQGVVHGALGCPSEDLGSRMVSGLPHSVVLAIFLYLSGSQFAHLQRWPCQMCLQACVCVFAGEGAVTGSSASWQLSQGSTAGAAFLGRTQQWQECPPGTASPSAHPVLSLPHPTIRAPIAVLLGLNIYVGPSSPLLCEEGHSCNLLCLYCCKLSRSANRSQSTWRVDILVEKLRKERLCLHSSTLHLFIHLFETNLTLSPRL